MKTKDIPAIVMLLAGGLYCLLGIYYQIPLMDFSVQLLLVLLIFWMIGGILKMVLDYFMEKFNPKTEEEADSEEESEENESAEEEIVIEDKQT